MDKERIRLTTLSSLVPRIDEEGRISHRFSDESASTVQSEFERSPILRDWSQASCMFVLLFTLRHGRGIIDLPAARFDDDRLPYPDEPAELRAIHELSDEEIDGIICYQSWFISSPETMSTENFVERKVAGHRRLLHARSYFKYDEKSLGRSNTAYICRVTHMPSRTDYAGKLFLRKRSDGYELFKRERSNLEKSRHHHLIDLVGTYTDRTHFVLILTPLAQYDLRTLLTASVSEDIAVDRADVLRRSFGCLASGLHYLHSIQVRHEDIKPGNILIHGGNVIICDLGIAYDWSDSEPTTDGAVELQTRRYSAPEVLNEDKRNAKADIWSLGCVFLEIITVLKRGMITDLHNFSRFPEVDAYCTHPERIMEWVEVLRKDDSFNDPLDWIEDMLHPVPTSRPSAQNLVEKIHAASAPRSQSEKYIGMCCLEPVKVQEAAQENAIQPHSSASERFPNVPPQFPLSPRWKGLGRSNTRNTEISNQSLAKEKELTTSPSFPSESGDSDEELTPPRALASTPRSGAASSHTTQISYANSFGYPSQVVNFSGIVVFRAELCAFELPPRHGSGEWDVQIPISGTNFMAFVSESDCPNLWQCSRILEIKTIDGRLRESTWLPLRMLRIKLQDAMIELEWSDCNHQIEKEVENYKRVWHRVFNASKPNNHLRLRFSRQQDAENLHRILLNKKLCIQSESSISKTTFHAAAKQGKSSRYHQMNIHICSSFYKCAYRGKRMIRIGRSTTGFATSDLYFAFDDHDVSITIQQDEGNAVIDLESIKIADYHSDVRDIPHPNDLEGRFCEAVLQTSKLSLKIVLGDHDLAAHDTDMKRFLHGMFGWDPLFFAPIKARRTSRIPIVRHSTDQGFLMLFKNESLRFRAKVVFLFQNGPDSHKWVAGEPVPKNPWKGGDDEGEITLRHILHTHNLGELLSVLDSLPEQGSSMYNLEFEKIDHLHSFSTYIRDIQKTRKAEQLQRATSGSQAGSVVE